MTIWRTPFSFKACFNVGTIAGTVLDRMWTACNSFNTCLTEVTTLAISLWLFEHGDRNGDDIGNDGRDIHLVSL